MYYAGIDIGSSMTKVVIIDSQEKIVVQNIEPTGAEHSLLAGKVMDDTLNQAGMKQEQLSFIMATGYGRINVPFAHRQMSEITCQAVGIQAIFPEAKTIIDIGGQDAKGLKLDEGRLLDFVMNDKCAAGTGRFLEILADSLDLDLADFGPLSQKAESMVQINNFCTVFARDEITDRISEGKKINDIIAGVHDAIAGRVVNMVKRIKIEPQVVFTAGLSTNSGMVKAIEKHTGFDVSVPSSPFTTVALGAAILGKKIWQENSRDEKK